MAETLSKLRPDRDLLCYFLRPSAVAALSEASETGFTVSGSWRQQFDWAVVEWNRDNTFEHPALRNLPDGDLSGITLSYQETRDNCIPFDSDLYPTVDWPFLRLWIDTPSGDEFHRVRLSSYAVPVLGSYQPASAAFTLTGTVTPGDYVEIAWDPFASRHFNYLVVDGDTISTVVSNLAAVINQFPYVKAQANGAVLTLTMSSASGGANTNRTGIYGTVSGTRSSSWQPAFQTFSGGTSPSKWLVTLPFSNLIDADTKQVIPTTSVRKMRWTYAAGEQTSSFVRSEFAVKVRGWQVTGNNLGYLVPGPGSRRIESEDSAVEETGNWTKRLGNYSGGSILESTVTGSKLTIRYDSPSAHTLLVGTRRAPNISSVAISVNGQNAVTKPLQVHSEDLLVRLSIGEFPSGTYVTTITHLGPDGDSLYFDFLELAIPSSTLPDFPLNSRTTLATDWDTDHSISLPPERTAWMINKLGYTGRANHYTGALWFFELYRAGTVYASATVLFNGTAAPNAITTIIIDGTAYVHVHLVGDTIASIAQAFALQINNGSTGVWANAVQGSLTVTARAMGTDGNAINIAGSTTQATGYGLIVSSATLSGGVDGSPTGIDFQDVAPTGYLGWRTDLQSVPRMNRAARDWSRGFYKALLGYGITATAAFSTELQFADPSQATAIAQRYPDQSPVSLNTPAIQTNFSPVSASYWEHAYAEMATLMSEAGQTPYLQFGEVQWWYFGNTSGLPLYDAYTTQTFSAQYGASLPVMDATSNPNSLGRETSFLSGLLGNYTNRIMQFVRGFHPSAKFEVLYPLDVNSSAINKAINYAANDWTPTTLTCLKTESFGFTGARDLDSALRSIMFPIGINFPRNQTSHLVGISDPTTPWVKESDLALGQNIESVVLFALDQFCLVGYTAQTRTRGRRSFYSV